MHAIRLSLGALLLAVLGQTLPVSAAAPSGAGPGCRVVRSRIVCEAREVKRAPRPTLRPSNGTNRPTTLTPGRRPATPPLDNQELQEYWAFLAHICQLDPNDPICPKDGAPPVALPTPEDLARSVVRRMPLPKPVPGRSPGDKLPDGRPTTYVNLSTWFYVPPQQYKPITVRAQAGAVWAEATATPIALTFNPGNGDPPVQCAGPGRPWNPDQDTNDTPPPDGCGYTYTKSSYGQPAGMVTATHGILWRITWQGSGGAGGTLPNQQTVTPSTFAVAEAQAVVADVQ